MNNHLNIFKTYTNKQREYQLENDLTRALAICLQEDVLFFHEVLKGILTDSSFYNDLFENEDSRPDVNISIQKKTSHIQDFDHVFAVSLSETEISNFWSQNHNTNYDPICDLVMQIGPVLIVIEAKRDAVNCTAQLYNQILNIYDGDVEALKANTENITPIDLSWPKLMAIAVKAHSFETATSNKNRFLSDFIDLVKRHNFKWFPLSSLKSLSFEAKSGKIYERFKSALIASEFDYIDSDRIGFVANLGWASEVLFNLDVNPIPVAIYPANTRQQGWQIFSKHSSFEIKKNLTILGVNYPVSQVMHVKFTSWQKFFTGLWFKKEDLRQEIYTHENFLKYTGRKKRDKHWKDIEKLFDSCFKPEYNWRQECNWEETVMGSGRNQFDMSFGYELSIDIPYKTFQSNDLNKDNIAGLSDFMKEIKNQMESILIIEEITK
jgi:hypothetical protein